MTPTSWSALHNAAHIDRVLASIRTEPDKWTDAWEAAWTAARDAAWGDALYAGLAAARGAAWDAAWGAAWGAAWSALAALIAWDDCACLLDWPEVQVRAHYELTGDPAALLLLPAVIVFSRGETIWPATKK